MKKDVLKDMRLMTIQTMHKIIEGCANVKGEKDIHQDAKSLATEVMKDCRNVRLFLEGEMK